MTTTQQVRPWPYGFLDSYWKGTYRNEVAPYDEEELAASAQYVLSSSNLSQRTKTVFKMRFQEYKTLTEIAETLGVSRERVRQITVEGMIELRKDRDYKGILVSGLKGYVRRPRKLQKEQWMDELVNERIRSMLKRCTELKASRVSQRPGTVWKTRYPVWDEKAYLVTDGSLEIEELDLTCRTYNCLKRSGLNKVQDILDMESAEKLMDIRNMGKKSYTDIITALQSHGYDVSHLVNRSYLIQA